MERKQLEELDASDVVCVGDGSAKTGYQARLMQGEKDTLVVVEKVIRVRAAGRGSGEAWVPKTPRQGVWFVGTPGAVAQALEEVARKVRALSPDGASAAAAELEGAGPEPASN